MLFGKKQTSEFPAQITLLSLKVFIIPKKVTNKNWLHFVHWIISQVGNNTDNAVHLKKMI